jgi:AcrR family transcriptional regulator
LSTGPVLGASLRSDPDRELIWFRRPRGRRGPEPTLSREQITRAAVELADAEGFDAVSMRRLASKLNAGATSLYWHVSSKDDLHELMVDDVIGEIPLPEASGDWKADLRGIARATYETCSAHRWIVLLGIQPGLGPKTRRFGQAALQAFDALGTDLSTRVNVLAVVNNYIFGFIHRAIAWQQLRERSGLSEEQWAVRLRTYLTEAGSQDPELAEHMAERFALVDRESFEFGLDCLLDGIAARLASRNPSPPTSPPRRSV